MKRPSVVAIVPSAGCGRRLESKVKKPFVLLRGRPLVTYAIESLERSGFINAIIIASEKDCVNDFRRLVRKFRFDKVLDIVVGGDTRFASVRNCLKRAGPLFDIALIHDGARPFLDARMIEDSVKSASRYGASVAAVRENDTVKFTEDGLFISKTIARDSIYRAQTPQAFRMDIIRKAYESCKNPSGVTDDSSLVEMLGERVRIVEGSYRNIKITTKEDLEIAAGIA